MRVIGLTGGIAAGKSTVSRLLAQNGALIVDADEIAKSLSAKGNAAYCAILDLFGPDYLLSDGELDRKKIAGRVFSSKRDLDALNRATHPLVYQEVQAVLARTQAQFVVIDAPLLFEAGLDALCEEVWVVVCDDAQRIERICRRDGCDRKTAEARIAAQQSQQALVKRAAVILENCGDRQALEKRVAEVLYEKKITR